MFTLPSISLASINPYHLLSADTLRLSPKTKYLPSGIRSQLQIVFKEKSSVLKL